MSACTARLTIADGERRPRQFASGAEHIQAELEWLRLLLHREILRLKAANLLAFEPFRGLYLADEQVDAILRDLNDEQARPQDPRVSDLAEQAAMLRSDLDAQLETLEAAGFPTPLTRLARIFGLTGFECHVLVAALAVEVDLRFEVLYSWVRNDVTRKCPSIDLVLKLFCEAPEESMRARAAFRANAPLFSRQLLRFSADQPEHDVSFLARSLRVDERILDFLLEMPGIDRRVAAFASLSQPSRLIAELHLPDELVAQLRRAANMRCSAAWYLCGPEGSGRKSAVEALCAEAGRALLTVDLQKLAESSLPLSTAVSLVLREAVLSEADLLLENAEAAVTATSGLSPLGEVLECMTPPGTRIFVAGEKPWPHGSGRQCIWHSFDFQIPALSARVQLWQDALRRKGAATDAGVDLELLAGRFALTGGAIERACADAALTAQIRGAGSLALSAHDLEAAARGQSNNGLCRFAQKVEGAAQWESLIVPPHIHRQLRDVCTAERHRHTVYDRWGFGRRLTACKGMNVLFCGSSGTGKTMAAGILARELGRDLYRIDLSIVVSKYIGETEKQLSQIFREAKTSNAMLFFDEADALFGKRSEVKDAHDRYANVEIAYLLQKMEEYEGIVILATNLRRNMDDAFSRRMHHVVEFPFPDAEHRERIWRNIFPPEAPVAEDVNFSFLARQFELAGGNIRNIGLASAFFAAEEGSPIRMEHCIVATALEMQKNGKLPSRAEFRDYYDLVRSRV